MISGDPKCEQFTLQHCFQYIPLLNLRQKFRICCSASDLQVDSGIWNWTKMLFHFDSLFERYSRGKEEILDRVIFPCAFNQFLRQRDDLCRQTFSLLGFIFHLLSCNRDQELAGPMKIRLKSYPNLTHISPKLIFRLILSFWFLELLLELRTQLGTIHFSWLLG